MLFSLTSNNFWFSKNILAFGRRKRLILVTRNLSSHAMNRQGLKKGLSKSNPIKFKFKRGLMVPYFKFSHDLPFESVDDKEIITDYRSRLLPSNFDFNLSVYNGFEHKPIPSGAFKNMRSVKHGFDYYANCVRGETRLAYFDDDIFIHKKNKIGEYVFTRRSGTIIHQINKKSKNK